MRHAILGLIVALFVSCGENDRTIMQVDFTVENEQEIMKYLEDNNLIAEKSDTGLYYIINEAGTGVQPTVSDNVTVAYKGYFTNDSVFDESDADGISFGLDRVIKGWTEGIPYFKEGGSGTLLIPAHLGYGGRSVGPIPGGSVLLFDITLLSVN